MRTLFLVAALLAAGCGSDNKCISGQSIACACVNGMTGAQTCGSDGRFGACQCEGLPLVDMSTAGGNDLTSSSTADMASSSTDMASSGGGAKRVFVTNTAYVGSSRATLIDACQNSAQAASLGGTWVTWLSWWDGINTNDAIDRVQGGGPWKLLNGQVAFANHAQLGTLPSVKINITETGLLIGAGEVVWTGTENGGRRSNYDCVGWSSSGSNGKEGDPDSTTAWTALSYDFCSSQKHLYCFEQ